MAFTGEHMSYMLNHRSGALGETPPVADDPFARSAARARQAAKADEDMLNQMLGDAPVQVAVVDADWRIVSTNRAWDEESARHGHGGLLSFGQSFRRFCEWRMMAGSETATAVLKAMNGIDEGKTAQFLHAYKSRDDEHLQISIAPFRIGDARFATVSRLNMEALLWLRRERLQLGAGLMRAHSQLIRAQEEERQRVARDLHDSAAQYLVGIGLGLANLRETSKDPAVAAMAEDLSGLLSQFHRDLRGLTYVLHPPQLETCGLHAAIEALCSGVASRSDIEVSVRVYGEDRMRGSAVETTIYRIVQEALSNIQRHAHARHVRVRLSDRAEALFVVIEDDGIGFQDAHEAEDAYALGVGIPGMMGRVSELGGRFVIRGRRGGQGTVLAAMVPRQGMGQAFLVEGLDALKRAQRHEAGPR